jgi:hypothetical protein
LQAPRVTPLARVILHSHNGFVGNSGRARVSRRPAPPLQPTRNIRRPRCLRKRHRAERHRTPREIRVRPLRHGRRATASRVVDVWVITTAPDMTVTWTASQKPATRRRPHSTDDKWWWCDRPLGLDGPRRRPPGLERTIRFHANLLNDRLVHMATW